MDQAEQLRNVIKLHNQNQQNQNIEHNHIHNLFHL